MKIEYLHLLQCPSTREDLKLEITEGSHDDIISGKLISSKCIYPIINGIPRFVKDEGYSSNFGWQWNRWAKIQYESENIDGPMEGHTQNMFNQITELNEEKLFEKKILDIGCGPGRFVEISKNYGAELVVALDYSSAIDAAKLNLENKDKIFFIQGDALNLPLKDGIFDFAYSIGVLHHTPDPKKGVSEAHRVISDNAEFAISVYSANSYYDYLMTQFWRNFFKFLWPFFGHWPPYLYSQIFGRINHYIRKVSRLLSLPLRLIFPSVTLPDIRWSILDTFDSITPSFQSSHTLDEVYDWYFKIGFCSIRFAKWDNIIGKK